MSFNQKGYDVKIVAGEIPQRYLCPFCLRLIRKAIQTSRGERACKYCYEQEQSKKKPGVCPIDDEDDTQIFPDRYADKEISEIKCFCGNQINGCEEILKVKDLQKHEEACLYIIKKCEKCNEEVLIFDLESHNHQFCLKRIIRCQFCEETSTYDEYKDHEAVCSQQPKDCPLHCGGIIDHSTIDQNEYKNHFLSCPKVLSQEACVYETIGCGGYNSNIHNQHDVFVVSTIKKLQDENSEMVKEIIRLNVMINEQAQKNLESNNALQEYEEEKKYLLGKIEAIEVEQVAVKEKNALIEGRLENNERLIKALMEKYSQHNAVATKATYSEDEMKDYAGKIDGIESSYTMLNKNLADLGIRQQLLENTCYDGHVLWKIDDLENRMIQAASGRVTALHSAPSFTRKFGFRFCSRIYLNGDGMGKNCYVSLFFVLMKSEYDVIQQWPFSDRVSFKLRHSSDPTSDIKESFTPDKSSSSFKKPEREMNVAAGCPMFISIEKLMSGGYIMQNSIFIETIIG